MMAAAGLVVGEHDFTSFAAVDPERVERMAAGELVEAGAGLGPENVQTSAAIAPTNVREIYSSAWTREGEDLIYTVRGNGFLHHMVRNLVGTFVLVGKGSINGGDLRWILAARNRSAAGATAPASGLFLVNVEY